LLPDGGIKIQLETLLYSTLSISKRLLTVLLLVSFTRVNAGAEFGLSGHDLLELCESKAEADRAICAYYIAGISGGFAQTISLTGDQPFYCLPMGIKLYQLPKLFVPFAADRPELLDYPADSLTAHMLKSSFPCSID